MQDAAIGHPAYGRVQEAIAWWVRHSDAEMIQIDREEFGIEGASWNEYLEARLEDLSDSDEYYVNHRNYSENERFRIEDELQDEQFVRFFAGMMGMY